MFVCDITYHILSYLIISGGLPWLFYYRSRSMVWRPYSCSLVQYPLHAVVNAKLSFCENVRQVLQNGSFDLTTELQSASASTASAAASASASVPLPYYRTPSLAAHCLRAAGVGLIAGYFLTD